MCAPPLERMSSRARRGARVSPPRSLGAGLLAGACRGEEGAAAAAAARGARHRGRPARTSPSRWSSSARRRGFQDVEIRARVEGFLEVVGFAEGTLVRKGQVLYRIDRKPLEASLANAQAELATAQARYEKTQNDVKRLQPLAAKQAVSAQELDNAVAAEDAARAQVEARKADVEQVSLDLGYTNVTSPIDGLVGTTLVKAGSLVGRGESTLLTTVSQIDPILFRAGISEAEYLRIARRADELRAAHGGEKIPIDLVLADGTVHPAQGLPRRGRARHRPDHRHPDASSSSSRTRAASSVPASTAVPGSSSSRRRTRCSCRSAPCRSCRTCTASPWSAATTRWRSRPSRSARVSAASGSIESGLDGQRDAWSSRACSGCAKAPSSRRSRRRRPPRAAASPSRRRAAAGGH